MKVFFDTNILVYIFDGDAPTKQHKARALLKQHVENGEALLSTQVLQEFYVTVTRKLASPLDPEDAYQATRDFALLPVVNIDSELVLAAAKRSQADQLSFWDALIVQSAIEGNATRLFSEDLQHGRRIAGLTVENPFR